MVTMGSELLLCDGTDRLRQQMGRLNQLRKTRHFCDVVLQVGSAEIHAHRAVLACASPYFFELFTADDDRRTAHEDKVVYKLSGSFEQESLERLVHFAYTGELELAPNIVRHAYVAANKLKMDRVAQACGDFLISQLTPETCLAVRTIPGIAGTPNLVDRLDRYIQDQCDLTRVTKDALGVCRLQLRVMLQNASEEVPVTSHALCLLALEWVRRQMEDEQVELQALREKKHLLYLNPDNTLHDCSDIKSGDMQDSELIQDYRKISRNVSHKSLKVSRKISTMKQVAKPRMMLYSRSISDEEEDQEAEWKLITHDEVAERTFVAIVTLNGLVSILSVMQVVNPPSPSAITPHHSRPASVEKVDSYTLIPHMTSPKCGSGTGSFHGNLLVCGGYDRGECLKEVEVYSPRDNTWTLLPDMKQGRGRFDLTVLDGLAYAVGGCNGSHELNSVDVLNNETKRWTSVAPLPLARSNTGVCSSNGKIYCIGGWNGYCGIKQCDAYDPASDTWTTIASLHTGRYQAGVATMDGRVFAVGGCDSWNCLSSVEVLDPELNIWRTVGSVSIPRRGCGAAVLNGKLYVMGGSDGTQSLCSTEVYDEETNTWSPGPSMTTCRANVGAVVLDGKLYAVGGFSGKNFLNSIEYLDPETMEWTNFTPKPEGYKSTRKVSKNPSSYTNSLPTDEEARSETQEDCSTSELDTSIPEEPEPSNGCTEIPAVNGILGRRETTNVH